MKEIEVSIDVFARIWMLRAPGEGSEDAILRRVLAVSSPSVGALMPLEAQKSAVFGVFDSRHGVQFPEGFEIFRTYLGREFRARAMGGNWVLAHDNSASKSLNELSRAIGARTENAWKSWLYLDEAGFRRAVSDLRSPDVVSSRVSSASGDESIKLKNSEVPSMEDSIALEPGDGSWRDDVKSALQSIGGRGALNNIYRETEKLRRAAGRTIPRTLEAVIRRTLEDNSSDSHNYRGGLDLFYMPEGKGAGVWALRD